MSAATDAYTALQSFQMPDQGTVLKQAEDKYGVGQAQSNVNNYKALTQNLTGAIAAVDPSVTARTSGSLVTEGQRGALVNRERAPIIGQLGTANQALGTANDTYNQAEGNAKTDAANTISSAQTKYGQLKDAYNIANAREEAAAAAQLEQQKMAEQTRQFNESQATTRGSAGYNGSGGGGGGGQAVDPAKDFLDYIGSQFKSAGGAGNKAITRQQQDAWANAFFQKNGVSNANRQQYWDLFNKQYNRTADPTKDWRYKR